MNQYPAWKYLLIMAVIVVGIIYALPNLFGDDPAVQVPALHGEGQQEPAHEQINERVREGRRGLGHSPGSQQWK